MSKTNQRQLDRLVDGELSEEERRQLLESFERNPDRWRQCACAFLEAQEFESALKYVDDAETVASPPAARVTSKAYDHADTASSNAKGWWLALAACLLIGFSLGQLGQGGDSHHPTVASDTPSQPAPNGPNGPALASDPPEAVLVHDSFGESILEQQYSAIPNDIEDVLDRLGQRVERRRVFMPVRSRGGQSGTVPVEEIEIVPVRMDTY